MSNKQLFEAFSEAEQEQYALEAEQLYGAESVRESNRKWKTYSAAQKETILAEGQAVYMDMIAAMPKGADSPEVQAIVNAGASTWNISGLRILINCWLSPMAITMIHASRQTSISCIRTWRSFSVKR